MPTAPASFRPSRRLYLRSKVCVNHYRFEGNYE
jgi:hypothetical protein